MTIIYTSISGFSGNVYFPIFKLGADRFYISIFCMLIFNKEIKVIKDSVVLTNVFVQSFNIYFSPMQ